MQRVDGHDKAPQSFNQISFKTSFLFYYSYLDNIIV